MSCCAPCRRGGQVKDVQPARHTVFRLAGAGVGVGAWSSAVLDPLHVAIGALPGVSQAVGALPGGGPNRGGHVGPVEPGLQPVPFIFDCVGVGLHGQDRELIAAQAGQDVGAAERLPQDLRGLPQQGVPGRARPGP